VSTVSQINDKSGNARHFSQGTALNQPSLGGTINGRHAITAHGLSVMLGNADSLSLTNGMPGFTIVSVATLTTIDANIRVLAWFSVGGSDNARANSGKRVSGFGGGGRRNDADGFAAVENGTSANTAASVMTLVGNYSATSLSLRLNGSQVAINSSWLTAGNASSTNSNSAAILNNPTGTSPWVGNFGEMLVWPRALAASELSYIETGLRRKWGVT